MSATDTSLLEQGDSADQSWRLALLAMLAIIIILVVGYWATFASLVEIWMRSGTFTHCFFVLPISLFLIWTQREQLRTLTVSKTNSILVPLFFLVLTWVSAYAADVIVVQQLAVIAMIPLIIWLVFGKSVFLVCLFPLLYLFFSVPIGEVFIAPLQDVTAAFTVSMLRISGIPVFWEGRFFNIPSGRFEVAEACSGIRYLIASLALGTLYAYLTFSSLYRRLLFIFLAVVVPIIANAIRAYGIVMIAHLSDYNYAVGFDHLIYGWLFFGVVMFTLFWLGSLFSDKSTVVSKNYEKIKPAKHQKLFQTNYFTSTIILSVIVLMSGPLAAKWIDSPITDSLSLIDSKQLVSPLWSKNANSEVSWNPIFKGASVELFSEYQKTDKKIQLYFASYQNQNSEGELINSQNTFYDRKQWRRSSDEIKTIVLQNNKAWTVHETVISSQNTKKVIWSWYVIGGKTTTNPIIAKLYTARSKLIRDNHGSNVFSVAANYELGREESYEVLKAFLNDSLLSLQTYVGSSD